MKRFRPSARSLRVSSTEAFCCSVKPSLCAACVFSTEASNSLSCSPSLCKRHQQLRKDGAAANTAEAWPSEAGAAAAAGTGRQVGAKVDDDDDDDDDDDGDSGAVG